MITLFSTADVHPRDRFDYWQSIVCKSITLHDAVPDCRQSFEAELKAEKLADVGLLLIENSAMTFAVTRAHLEQATSDDLFVCQQLRGRLTFEQEGRQAVLEPGVITLIDPRAPYTGRIGADSKELCLKVPRRLIEARLGSIRDMSVRALKPLSADTRFVSEFLATVPAYAGKLGKAAEQVIMDHAVELIALALAEIAGKEQRLSSARSVVMMRVRAAIEARLPDSRLDSQTIAAAAGVSVRYANVVLAQEGTSIQRLVLARRLARCRAALEDRAQAHRSISEIAFGWGFSDMTHFGRKFRDAYGMLPSEYRRSAQG